MTEHIQRDRLSVETSPCKLAAGRGSRLPLMEGKSSLYVLTENKVTFHRKSAVQKGNH